MIWLTGIFHKSELFGINVEEEVLYHFAEVFGCKVELLGSSFVYWYLSGVSLESHH